MYNQVLSDVLPTGAGIKCLHCRSTDQCMRVPLAIVVWIRDASDNYSRIKNILKENQAELLVAFQYLFLLQIVLRLRFYADFTKKNNG